MRIKFIGTIFFILSGYYAAFAQLATNPPEVSWRQINTEHFKIIFPIGLEAQGRQMANTLEYIHQPLASSLGSQPRKIPIVLQNQGVISNGFVTLAPRRSEFYTIPTQNYNLLGTNNWLNFLAMHEYRHIVQYEKAYRSWAKLGYYLFGQNGLTLLSHVAMPSWFWEGDAVAIETAYSTSGRGRIPDFNLLFRTNLLERGPFSYNKQYLGSFKDNVPDHWVTGYHLVAHGRSKHGEEVWGKVTQKALDRFYVPFTFSKSLKQVTGKRLVSTYRDMVQELDSLWTQQADNLPTTAATIINRRKNKTYTNYLYPQPLTDGSVVVIKTGLSDIQTFVRISPDGEEKKLFTPGNLNNGPLLSVVKDKIVWSELEYDPRWTTRSYSVIKTYDMATNTYRVLKRRTRLTVPVWSPDAQTIAAIEVNTENIVSLVLINAVNGEEINRFKAPDQAFIQMPRWSPDGRNMVLLLTHNNRRTIATVNLETGVFTNLIPYTSENIGHPVWSGNYIYYNSPYNGIENIYALDWQSKKQYQVAARRYAAINPAITAAGDTLLFNDFSAAGYNIAKMPNNPAAWVPLEQVKRHEVAYYAPIVEQEGNPDLLANVPMQDYPVAKYSKLKNSINVHSWLPVLGSEHNSASVALLSQDILSTTASSVGYVRNLSENSGRLFAGLSYQGLLPVINFNAAVGYRTALQDDSTAYQWKEKTAGLGLALPLNLTRSKYRQFLTLSTNANISYISNFGRNFRTIDQQANGVLRHVNYQVAYQRTLRQSRRDLAGRFEQRGLVHFNHTPFGGNYQTNLLAANARFAFPGLFRHHSLQIRGNYQKQNINNYVFSSPLRFPRGYDYRVNDQFYSLTAQYLLPVWYPDLALGPFFYFQRLKGNLFYDYGKSEYQNKITPYQSVGIELATDFNFMRLNSVLLEAGIRVSYLPKVNKPVFELTVGEFGL